MTSTIKIKNSSTAGAVPGSGDLVQGELAVNVTDKKIYTKNASGTVVNLGTTPSITDNGNAEAIVIDSSENVGLGVTPSAWGGGHKVLQLAGSASASFTGDTASAHVVTNAYYDGTNWKYLTSDFATDYFQYAGQHVWRNAASGSAGSNAPFTQAMTLDASGNLGVGTTSPVAKLQVDAPNFALATAYNTLSSNFAVRTNTTQAANVGGEIALGGYSNGTSGAVDFVRIHGKKENSTAGNVSGYLAFEVSNDGGPAPYIFERARIDSSGNLLVGATGSIGGTCRIGSYFDGSAANGMNFRDTYASTGGYFIGFYNSSNTFCGGVNHNGTATVSYATSSDYRLKNSVTPMTGALAKVAALKPCTYKWNADNSDGEGFIAHELAEVCPQAVVGAKDAVDADGNPVYQGIDTSFLVATLTAAIQELNAKFEAYKAAHP